MWFAPCNWEQTETWPCLRQENGNWLFVIPMMFCTKPQRRCCEMISGGFRLWIGIIPRKSWVISDARALWPRASKYCRKNNSASPAGLAGFRLNHRNAGLWPALCGRLVRSSYVYSAVLLGFRFRRFASFRNFVWLALQVVTIPGKPALETVLLIRRSGKSMRLIRINNQHGVHTQSLQSLIKLLWIDKRDIKIFLTAHD